jgi:NAD(P)-dependent dehydrogenase (short-subunit alcohol dehydrogenase family)
MQCSKKVLGMSKVAVITGSSGGIGSALVRTYLDDGYFVIGLDRTPCEYPVRESYIEINLSLLQFSKDISYRDDVIAKIKEHLPNHPKKLVVINNAAEQILKSVSELEWEDWDNSLSVNTVAPFFLVQGLLEELKLSHGSVINVSSIHAKLTKPRFTCYAASKAALEALTRSLALELSPLGISVNAVAPAAISTDMLMAGFKDAPDKLKALKNYHPSRCIGTPEDVSFFVKAIADQEGGFLTGAVLDFNGGLAGRLHDPE